MEDKTLGNKSENGVDSSSSAGGHGVAFVNGKDPKQRVTSRVPWAMRQLMDGGKFDTFTTCLDFE